MHMDDAVRPAASDARTGSFDVRAWLAGMARVHVDQVIFVSDHERSGRRTVTYDCAGVAAKVRIAPVAGAAAWELTAEVGEMADRVLLPGATRFVWRAPRGTHA
jgi:hypothetical protein